ncbi:MAG: FAD/NAD(P)-binding oxidoreductase [Candidatus Bathyarchaeia archaeon]
MGKNILILGGGFGGLAAANKFRKGLSSEHTVTLVDKQPLFFMGLTKLWVINGRRQVGQNPGNRTLLAKRGINFVEGEVSEIDLANREVRIGTERFTYDYLIIALGADYSLGSPKGFARYAKNMYTESGCAEIRDLLPSLRGGTLTVLVCGLPFKCPPAPYEASMIIDDVLRKNGIRDKVRMQIVTPEAHPLGILGSEAGKRVTTLLASREIAYYPSQKVKEIRQTSILTEEGKEIPHDAIFAIPIHVAPSVLKNSRLLDESGWIPVDSATLATEIPNVYAIGDCADPKTPKGAMLPRAGVLAEEQGKVVAQNIINEIQGAEKSAAFDGQGVCFMEAGDGIAAPLRANFYAQPNPEWELEPPSEDGFRQKQNFLEDRMKAWFD